MSKALRSLAVLFALALGAFALATVTDQLVSRSLLDSYGYVSVDTSGRLRHWRRTHDGGVVILSADSLEVPGTRHEDSMSWRMSTRLSVTLGTRAVGFASGASARSYRMLDGSWLRETVLIREDERELVLQHQAGRSWLAHRVEGDHRVVLVGEARLSRETFKGEVVFAAGRSFVLGAPAEKRKFIGVVGDEYWVLEMDGTFLRREKLGHDGSRAVAAVDWMGTSTIALRFRGARSDPGDTEFEFVVCPPDGPVLHRTVVLRPVTWKQHFSHVALFAASSVRPALLAPDRVRVVSICLGALCAWLAYRSTRRRALSRFWILAGLIMGPIGLLWMRLSVPWVAIENGRAVNIGEWPEPERNGTEVFS